VITSLGQIREGLFRPTRIDIDDNGNLYISDARQKTIQKWDMYGREIASFSGFPVNGAFAVAPDGSRLYVCGNDSVSIVDANSGAILGTLGKGEGEFGYAYDIDLDAQGNVYAIDALIFGVRVYNSQGKWLYTFGSKGVANGQFNGMNVLVVHPGRGEVYVADSTFPDPYFPKVQVFTLGGTWLRTMNSQTAFGQALYSFGGIAFDDSGRGYFLNLSKSWMSVIDLPTTYRNIYGVEGVTVGKLLAPRDVAWDPVNKRLFVLCADSRLEIFGIDGGTNPVNRNVAPGLPVPITPVAYGEVTSATPVFTFKNAVDPDGDVLTYNIRLQQNGQDAVEFTGIQQGDGQSSFQINQALSEDSTYTWSIQASDGRLTSAWSIPQSFKVNATQAPPTVPVALSPIGGSEVASATPLLTFGNASDSDSAILTYNIRLQQNGQTIAEFNGISQGEIESAYKIGQPLSENETYAWSVQATDGKLSSDWSTAQTFIVNAIQEAPGAPALIAPASGESVDGSAQFSWAQAIDPDPGDTVRYLLQISDESGFATPLIEEAVDVTRLTLGDCAAYPDLVEGDTYYWRVLAIDNEGLASEIANDGSFVYDTTILVVTANVPGTRIYLGGNYAYAGQFVGEAPLELRDLAPGTYQVVAERAGLEPFITQLTLDERQNVAAVCNMISALVPANNAQVPLSAGGQKIVLGGAAAPFVIDLDGDQILDLLVGDATGALTFYRGLPSEERSLSFAAGSNLGLFLPDAIPFVADWNNDGRFDLLLGAQNGTVSLYLDSSAAGLPKFTFSQHLSVSGVPIQVNNAAAPAIIDFDNDGDKDLLVGGGDGVLNLYSNSGSDQAPVLAAPVQVAKLAAPASYFLSDWNADGRRDLLSTNGGIVSVALRQADGTFAAAQTIGDLKKVSVEVLRLFACDYDNFKGKDLFAGTAGGQIYLAKGNGNDPVSALQGALLAKIDQIAELASATGMTSEIVPLRAAAEAGDYKAVWQQSELLLPKANSNVYAALQELFSLLK
jgi:WD40 repeat protein